MAQLSSCLERVVNVLTSSVEGSRESQLRELVRIVDGWIEQSRAVYIIDDKIKCDAYLILDFVVKAKWIHDYSSELNKFLTSATCSDLPYRDTLSTLSQHIVQLVRLIIEPYVSEIGGLDQSLTRLQIQYLANADAARMSILINSEESIRKMYVNFALSVLDVMISEMDKFKRNLGQTQ